MDRHSRSSGHVALWRRWHRRGSEVEFLPAALEIVERPVSPVPRLIGGTVVTEAVFGWPGMGRLALEAAQGRDYPLVTGLTVVVAAIAVLASLLVDLAYTRLDPRLRLT